MLDIDEMGQDEIHELLHKVGYGHLGFIYEGKPCVMPIHYYLENTNIYLLDLLRKSWKDRQNL